MHRTKHPPALAASPFAPGGTDLAVPSPPVHVETQGAGAPLVLLHGLMAHAAAEFEMLGIARSGSQIVPVILGDDARTMEVAAAVQAAGFDVRGIRPPTVPAGTSRLRISLTLNVTLKEVTDLAQCLAGSLR